MRKLPPHQATVQLKPAFRARSALPPHPAVRGRTPLKTHADGVLQRMDDSHLKAQISVQVHDTPFKYIVATIHNAGKAYYYVPDGRTKSIDKERLKKTLVTLPEIGNQPWKTFVEGTKRFVEESNSAPTKIHEFRERVPFPESFGKESERMVPLRTLKDWHTFHGDTSERKKPKNFALMVNANWFSIPGPNHPHLVPTAYLYGLSVKKGKMVSSHKKATELGSKLDALAVFEGDGGRRVAILKHENIEDLLSTIQFAVAGFSILEGGEVRERVEASASPAAEKRRTGVGISADGRTLHVVVVETPIKLKALSELFKKDLGDWNAIDLDNSGSSQMVHDGKELTAPEDTLKYIDEERRYRPVPNFFAIGTEPFTKQ
jgi:hypothetical protein